MDYPFVFSTVTVNSMTMKSQSKVLEWAEAQKESNENFPPIKLLSDATIYAITRFALPHPEPAGEMDSMGETLHRGASNVMLSYLNDSSLFELGCYVYFRIDLWHVQNKYNEFRERVLNFCLDEFISVFEDALGFDYANEILQNRLDLYGQLIREGDLEAIDFYLLQLLMRTRNNTLPKVHNFDGLPIEIADFFEQTFLKIALKSFEAGILPAILQNFKHIYESESING